MLHTVSDFLFIAGGRYDNLMGQFGDNKGAVGAAIGINRLISVLSDKEVHDVSASLVLPKRTPKALPMTLHTIFV